ncbi:MAG: hypothetical protein KBG85_08435 [Micropruina sp.]|nr:hypothetical protein [Micropruina sp.]
MNSRPSHVRPMSTDRRVAVAVLGIVSVVATLAVLLGDQFVRTLGLIALVSGAALACALAWRAVRSAERRAQAQALGAAMQAAEQLRAERARHRAVITALEGRIAAQRTRADEARLRACRLQQELSTMRGNYEALRVELELQAALGVEAGVTRETDFDETEPWATARALWFNADRAAS